MPSTGNAWDDLKAAIELLSQHPTDETSPFHCEHDTLTVRADDTLFTPEEIAELDDLGFFVDTENGGFYSFRFGSA